MEKYSMNCPNCGGVLNDIDGLDTFFVSFVAQELYYRVRAMLLIMQKRK